MADFVYSKEFEKICREHLGEAPISRVSIHEWRNFIDYDLIPLYKKLREADK